VTTDANRPLRLTRAQAREIDRLAAEEYHIPGIVLMENASRAIADAAEQLLSVDSTRGTRTPQRNHILILCGGGNNGGDGLAAARHLHNRGHTVRIGLATDPARYRGDAQTNWNIVQAMRLPTFPIEPDELGAVKVDLVIDAIFGTGLTEAPRDPFPSIVNAIRVMNIPVLAVDVPSGLDCDTGRPLGPACVRATRTVTLAAHKAGFTDAHAPAYLGQVVVGDIGCPRELIARCSDQK
jgi:NAD(P)H-hydrate epimerase